MGGSTISKATQRRERRLAKDLDALSTTNPIHFVHVWNLYLKGWCEEVLARGRGLNRGQEGSSLGSVYAVMRKAECLLHMVGAEGERLVGAHTRQTLNHECCKAVAIATDPRMYPFDSDSVYRMMRTRARVR